MKYNKISDSLSQKFKEIVGEENHFSEYEIRWTYAFGPTIFEKEWVPDLVLVPENTSQVSRILKLANEHKIPVYPRGSGTSLSASHLSALKGLVLDLSQMNKILSIDIENNLVEVEPGVICDELNEQLKKNGYFFPPEPGSSSVCTIGGMVSTNAGGVQAFKYGVTIKYVMYLDVVLANGEILHFGSKVLKSVSSYNLKDLFVGSEGTLGIITKIGLRIRPLPQKRKLGFFVFDNIKDLHEAVLELRRKGIVPNLLEFIDKVVIGAIYEYLGGAFLHFPIGYVLMAEVDGNSVNAVEKNFNQMLDVILGHEPSFHRIAQTPEEREQLVNARKANFPALLRIKPSTCTEDCSIPITEFCEVVKEIEQIPEKINASNLLVGIVCHMDGNMHPKFLFNENNAQDLIEFQKAMDHLYKEIIIPHGGSITGEHGIGKIKTPYMELEHQETVFHLMAQLKKLFDPNDILNPGAGKGNKMPLKKIISSRNLKNQPGKILELNCMRCGYCIPSCPSRFHYKTEAYTPRGRLSILNGIAHGELDFKNFKLVNDILHACTLCGDCLEKCPAGVNTQEIFERARAIVHENRDKTNPNSLT
ncbi:MAG: FAD-binding oxidoreductase [Promethearchaeota archaeon]|nr:MAG: FAD-binding oxidoreductase [Candidatus Lokiarchaeota archaeon]